MPTPPRPIREARCIEAGCGVHIKWITGPGRIPERCPKHQAIHQRTYIRLYMQRRRRKALLAADGSAGE